MPTLNYLGENYSCARAQKGGDFVRLLDDAGDVIFLAEGITDFSGFVLTDGEWEPAYAVMSAPVGALATVSGGVIALEVPGSVKVETGLQINFTAPCPCADVTGGLLLNGVTYTVVDALGNTATGKGGTWESGALVSVLVDVENARAYIQNAAAAPVSHVHDAGDITSGTMPVARGGTGITENPSMLTNLGSTIAASVFASSPRPGVTGTLPVANGGTGKASFTANRLIYPSASTTLAQLAFPSVAGSVLRQGTSGAPYWTSIADLATALGGPKIETGSYVGTGNYSGASVSINLGFKPKIVFISKSDQVDFNNRGTAFFNWCMLIYGTASMTLQESASKSVSMTVNLTWGENSLTITGTAESNNLNAIGSVYNYVAIG